MSGQWGFDKQGLWMKAPSAGKAAVKPIQETKADAWESCAPAPGAVLQMSRVTVLRSFP